MEKFKATKVEDKDIELANAGDLEKLYTAIENDENFILQWKEGSVLHSEVIITTHLSAKVKNGELKLTSKEAE